MEQSREINPLKLSRFFFASRKGTVRTGRTIHTELLQYSSTFYIVY